MKMTGSHAGGGALGGVASIVLIALGKRAGLTLTNEEAVSLFGMMLTIGIGAGHAWHKLMAVGIVPAWHKMWFGPTK